MVPSMTWSDPMNGLTFRGGALELGTQAHWGLQMGLDGLIKQHRSDQRALGAAVAALAQEIDQLGPSGYASLPLAEFGPFRRHPHLPRVFEAGARPVDAPPPHPVTHADKRGRGHVPPLQFAGV